MSASFFKCFETVSKPICGHDPVSEHSRALCPNQSCDRSLGPPVGTSRIQGHLSALKGHLTIALPHAPCRRAMSVLRIVAWLMLEAVALSTCARSNSEVGERPGPVGKGGGFVTYSWIFLLTLELLCLQSVDMLLRHTFPLQAKKLNCMQKSFQTQL